MKIKNEDTIKAQIDTINDMLNIVCEELNELETIDDYEIELNETNYTSCMDKKQQKNYKIIVTVMHNLEKEVE